MRNSKLDDEYNADLAIESLKNDYGDFPKKAENFWKPGQFCAKMQKCATATEWGIAAEERI